jgi:hypothetical protein
MAEGGGKSFGVFRVKNHNCTPKISRTINTSTGADPGGGRTRRASPPPKIGKNMIFWRKIVIFHGIYSSTEVYIISVISSRLYKTKAIEIDIKCHLH